MKCTFFLPRIYPIGSWLILQSSPTYCLKSFKFELAKTWTTTATATLTATLRNCQCRFGLVFVVSLMPAGFVSHFSVSHTLSQYAGYLGQSVVLLPAPNRIVQLFHCQAVHLVGYSPPALLFRFFLLFCVCRTNESGQQFSRRGQKSKSGGAYNQHCTTMFNK